MDKPENKNAPRERSRDRSCHRNSCFNCYFEHRTKDTVKILNYSQSTLNKLIYEDNSKTIFKAQETSKTKTLQYYNVFINHLQQNYPSY
jgi:hypothetical protein